MSTRPLSQAPFPSSDGQADRARLRALEAEVAQLHDALQSQRVTGAATGLLAQRYACSTEAAWGLLTRISSRTNTKLRVVARVIVESFDGRARSEDAALLSEIRRILAAEPGGRSSGEVPEA